MTNKESLIESQKELIRESVTTFILAILSLVAGHVYYSYSLARDNFLVLYAGFIAGLLFLLIAIGMFGFWSYFQGYLKHMPDNDPLPRKHWPGNVIPFRRRTTRPPEDTD